MNRSLLSVGKGIPSQWDSMGKESTRNQVAHKVKGGPA